mgnify:CR=1 FL=1
MTKIETSVKVKCLSTNKEYKLSSVFKLAYDADSKSKYNHEIIGNRQILVISFSDGSSLSYEIITWKNFQQKTFLIEERLKTIKIYVFNRDSRKMCGIWWRL